MSGYPVVSWYGLYGEGWGDDIVPEAFSHPAKYSRALIRYIYQYLIDNHLIERGARVLDPFGGVALGALDAQLQGLHWTGCELEPKFVELGNRNLALWLSRYAPHFPRWGSAQLLQGDSRKIGEVIAGAVGGVVSSPPYVDSDVSPGNSGNRMKSELWGENKGLSVSNDYGTSSGQLGAMPSGDVDAILSSPPYDSHVIRQDVDPNPDGHKQGMTRGHHAFDPYGESVGQLGAMPSGDYGAVIASPPFIQTSGGTNVTSTEGPLSDASLIHRHAAGNQAQEAYGGEEGQLQNMREGDVQAVIASPPFTVRQPPSNARPGEDIELRNMPVDTYGSTTGQLASLPEGDVSAVVSSPPYEGIQQRGTTKGLIEHGTGLTRGSSAFEEYGSSDGQLGNEAGDSFWSASLAIVSQCYALLAPGGVAVWVCKDYVRNKKRVPFSDQWRMLCEKVGFTTLTEVHAWVVEDNGTQLAFGEVEDKQHRKERKSFFRRLAEKKGSPRIDWETVWIMRKPVDTGAQK